jgi:hypothetical protein
MVGVDDVVTHLELAFETFEFETGAIRLCGFN